MLHLFHEGFCTVVPAYFELQESEAAQGNNTGEQMAADLAVGPVKHGVYPDMAACPTHSKLLFNPIAIHRCGHNFLGAPVTVVGDNDVFAQPLGHLCENSWCCWQN